MDHPTYDPGQCTRFVADNWSQPVGPYWGDGKQWLVSAMEAGYVIAETPQLGAIAVWGANAGGAGPAGHVAIVAAVEPLTVSESNWDEPLRPDSRVVSPASAAGIVGYILPELADQETPMTPSERVDVARALTRLTYATAAHRTPESQAAEDQLVSRAAGDPVNGFDYMVRDLLLEPEFAGDQVKQAAELQEAPEAAVPAQEAPQGSPEAAA